MAVLYGDCPPCEFHSAVAVDVETTGLYYLDDLLGFSLAWHTGEEIKSCYIDLAKSQLGLYSGGKEIQNEGQLVKEIVMNNVTVWHSLPFDYRFLFKEYGMPAPWMAHDVVHMARCVGHSDSLSLVNLYLQYVKQPLPNWYLLTKQRRSSLKFLEPNEVARYGRADAYFTLQLFDALKGRIPNVFGDMNVYAKDIEFTRLVMDLIRRGISVNREWLLGRKKEASRRIMELEVKYPGINLNSSQQVSKILLGMGAPISKKTSTGAPSISQEVLEELAVRYPFASEVLEYRGHIKAISSWVEPLLAYSKEDGKIHARLNPFGTVSFRMSCQDINLQGLPMHDRGRVSGSLQGAFRASKPNCSLWACDLKQAEVRLAAMLAKDTALIKVIREGQDPYTSMAVEVWGNATRRDDAKRATLASLYEIGTASFAKRYNLSLQAAGQILEEFRSRFPDIKRASKRFERFASQSGYVPLVYGHKRWFGPNDEFYKAFNQHVQGSLAELMERIMLQIEEILPGSLRLQIHDSVVLELSDDSKVLEEQKREISAIVQKAVPKEMQYAESNDCSVPLLVDFEKW